jgi:hypothetical protein
LLDKSNLHSPRKLENSKEHERFKHCNEFNPRDLS